MFSEAFFCNLYRPFALIMKGFVLGNLINGNWERQKKAK